MEKTIFGQMGGTYHEKNGYLIPNLTLPPGEEMFSRMVKQIAEREGVTEKLKVNASAVSIIC